MWALVGEAGRDESGWKGTLTHGREHKATAEKYESGRQESPMRGAKATS